jgi:hypothetical protein
MLHPSGSVYDWPEESKDLLNFTVRLCESGAETDLDGKGLISYSDASRQSSRNRKRKQPSLDEAFNEKSLAEKVSDCLHPVLSVLKSSM